MLKIISFALLVFAGASVATAQNSNSSTSGERPRTTNTNTSRTPPATPTEPKKQTTTTAPKRATRKPASSTQSAGPEGVLAAFNSLLEGIRQADVDEVMGVYWKNPRLSLFNYNGTVTKGWEQVRSNRESSYPEIKDVKLEVRDVSVTMLGRDGAIVTCLWTQTQNYKGTPETVSGRMTLVFKRVGTEWKAIHLHSSTDKPNPGVVPPSEQQPTPTPSPNP